MIVYDLFLLLFYVLSLPKVAYERAQGKRHPSVFQRLGFFTLKPHEKKTIWIHAVSVGEVKAAAPLFHRLKKEFPDSWICFTTTTATGQAEAKRIYPTADAVLYMPLDLSFCARRFVRKIKPSLFFLIESDFWLNILAEVQRQGGKTFVISGKISSKSAARLRYVPFFAKHLFSRIDCLCVQTEEYAKRFSFFAKKKIYVTGNLKFDMQPQKTVPLPKATWITLSCTHAPEEELLLDRLLHLPCSFLVAPRHPERFVAVAELLKKKNISFVRWKDRDQFQGEKVILVDTMGVLSTCYAQSLFAIVGGSFIPSIGGHNVWEPCIYGCPSLFGPFTFSQKELVSAVLDSGSGIQTSLDELLEKVKTMIEHRSEFAERALRKATLLHQVTETTWSAIKSHM